MKRIVCKNGLSQLSFKKHINILEVSSTNILFPRTTHETTWAPSMWAVTLLQQERSAGRYKPEAAVYVNVINAFEYLEISNRRILNHGWVNFPFGKVFFPINSRLFLSSVRNFQTFPHESENIEKQKFGGIEFLPPFSFCELYFDLSHKNVLTANTDQRMWTIIHVVFQFHAKVFVAKYFFPNSLHSNHHTLCLFLPLLTSLWETISGTKRRGWSTSRGRIHTSYNW